MRIFQRGGGALWNLVRFEHVYTVYSGMKWKSIFKELSNDTKHIGVWPIRRSLFTQNFEKKNHFWGCKRGGGAPGASPPGSATVCPSSQGHPRDQHMLMWSMQKLVIVYYPLQKRLLNLSQSISQLQCMLLNLLSPVYVAKPSKWSPYGGAMEGGNLLANRANLTDIWIAKTELTFISFHH